MFDVFARPRRCFQNLNGRNPPRAVGARQQSLRDNVSKRLSQTRANYLFFILGKDTDDPFDSFRGVYGVQGRQHQMACFRRFQGHFHGIPIAHLAHQDDLWRLTQGGPQSQRKIRRICVKLALMNR